MQEQKIVPDFSIENSFKNLVVAGIDEAGRGPLAGPVVAACVILDRKNFPLKINDSKKISPKFRHKIFMELKEKSHFGIGIVEAKIIDEINILQATKLAMLRAYEDLCCKYSINPQIILVDGNFVPFELQNGLEKIEAIVKGDQKSMSIAAASILAKETRDEIMRNLHQKFPKYGWDKNSAYPTKLHVDRIHQFGICEFHRKSFEPIKSLVK